MQTRELKLSFDAKELLENVRDHNPRILEHSVSSSASSGVAFLLLFPLPVCLFCCRHHRPPQIVNTISIPYILISWTSSSPCPGPLFICFILTSVFSPCEPLLGISSKVNFWSFKTHIGSKVSFQGKPWHSRHPRMFTPTGFLFPRCFLFSSH